MSTPTTAEIGQLITALRNEQSAGGISPETVGFLAQSILSYVENLKSNRGGIDATSITIDSTQSEMAISLRYSDDDGMSHTMAITIPLAGPTSAGIISTSDKMLIDNLRNKWSVLSKLPEDVATKVSMLEFERIVSGVIISPSLRVPPGYTRKYVVFDDTTSKFLQCYEMTQYSVIDHQEIHTYEYTEMGTSQSAYMDGDTPRRGVLFFNVTAGIISAWNGSCLSGYNNSESE